jgi:hypothetical protein
MKLVSKHFLLLALSATVVLSGCAKKPVRPDPSATLIGPNTGGNINPQDVATTADQNSGLQQRLGDGVIDDGRTIRGLLGAVYFEFDRSDISKPDERAKLKAAKEYYIHLDNLDFNFYVHEQIIKSISELCQIKCFRKFFWGCVRAPEKIGPPKLFFITTCTY